MTRAYRCVVEVHDVPAGQVDEVEYCLQDWFAEVKDSERDPIRYSGFNSLGGGMSERVAHERIRDEIQQIAPEAKVNSYWQYIEHFDFSFEDKPASDIKVTAG